MPPVLIENNILRMYKNILYSLLIILCTSWEANGQNSLSADSLPYPAILSDMLNVQVVQDSSITLLLQEKIAGITHSEKEGTGWRVQVFSSNTPVQAKTDALTLEARLKESINQPIYIVTSPPFIKVRIGDFRTQEEALNFKNELIELFPDLVGDTYIVRDEHIKIR